MKSRHTLKFLSGDLGIIRDDFKWTGRHMQWGPPVVGHRTISTSEINPGETFLILQGAKESSHRYNRKLYVEVMTEKGPRIAWASIFKMRKVASEMEVLS